jgi:phosphosulfolactate synthase (CoM biosynthesis protein A)
MPNTTPNSENAKELGITSIEICDSNQPWTLEQRCEFIELKEALDYVVLSWMLWKTG